jgi:hypothetical protein
MLPLTGRESIAGGYNIAQAAELGLRRSDYTIATGCVRPH